MIPSRAKALAKAAGLLSATLALAATAPAAQRDSIALGLDYYGQLCASCHGNNMEGSGSGNALRGAPLKWGEGREGLFRSIHDGIEDMGMPAYGGALTDEQIMLIVDAILEESTVVVPASAPRRDADARQVLRTLDYEVRVEPWVDGLSTPWDIVFLDADRALVTEKTGTLRLVEDGVLHPDPIRGTPATLDAGQGGLMAVAIDPEFAENGWIYLGFTDMLPSDRQRAQTAIVRGRIADHEWTDEEVVFRAPEDSYTRRRHHYGTRIVFCREGYLYFAIGDRGDPPTAQDPGSPNGRVHRLHRDGRVPDDNPFLDRPEYLPSTWSYGHRNQQGLAFHPVTDDLYGAEHGPRGGDEVNLVLPGLNYGWPEVTWGINYNGTVITRERSRPGFEPPVWMWRPSTAVCGISFYTGNEFPLWRNHMLASALANETLRLLRVENQRIFHEEILLEGMGRIRQTITGPDGALYVVLNEPDEILRLTAVREALR